jgi:hypothetical protein
MFSLAAIRRDFERASNTAMRKTALLKFMRGCAVAPHQPDDCSLGNSARP